MSRARTLLFGFFVGGLLLPAVTITLLRLLQSDAGLAVQVVAFAPLALAAYAVVFVTLLVVLVVALRRGTRPTGVAGLLALAVVGLGLHGWWISPQFVGAGPQPGAGQVPLVVMNLNLFVGEADPGSVVETAAAQRAEVLVLEEVTPEALRALDRHRIAGTYRYRVGKPTPRVAGTMVFSRYPISSVHRLGTSFESLALDVAAPAGVVHLYAVHPYPPVRGAGQWRDDLAAIASAAGEDPDVDLIVGDFNATPDHRALQRFADLDFRSASESTNAGWQPTWPANGLMSILGIGLPAFAQIDHVLVGRAMAALTTRTVTVPGTDHRALVAEVAFR